MTESDRPQNLKDFFKQVYNEDENITLLESSPILLVHLVCLFAFVVGFSGAALAACLVTYFVRVFALTAGYHRYFSHHSFKTSRVFQFILAWLGASSAQLGPIWWASHHRHHHQHSDTPEDVHAPALRGFFWSHIGWLLCKKYSRADDRRVGDLLKFPELRFIDRFHAIPPLVLIAALYALGHWLGAAHPALGTSGWQMVIWGFFISTVMVYHVTFCINSVTHMFGKRRFATKDHSRNSLILALITMGEGWHNNHHRYPVSMRQGFYWWEIDMTYYLLLLLSKLGIIWDVKAPPRKIYEEAEAARAV